MATKTASKAKAPAKAVETPAQAAIPGSGKNPGSIPALEAAGAAVASELIALAGGPAEVEKKKGKMPEIYVRVEVEKMRDGKPVKLDGIAEYLKALKDFADAENRVAQYKAPIVAVAEPERVKLSRQHGGLEPSLRLKSQQGEAAVTFKQPHGYHQVPYSTEAIAKLKKHFGDEGYARYFKTATKLAVAKDADISSELVADLKAVAEKRNIPFKALFDSKVVLAGTEALTSDRVLRPEIEAQFKAARDDGAIEPNAPSVVE